MGFFDNLFGGSKTVELKESVNTQQQMQHLALELHDLRESYTGLEQLQLENYGWDPVGGWNKGDGFDLRTVTRESETCRQMYAINPLIKKAVTARVGMVHGRGTRIVAESEQAQKQVDKIIDTNKRKIFGKVARTRLEAELSTTGNVFILQDGAKPAVVIPLNQIVGYISEVDDTTKILYWKRSYSTVQTDLNTGNDSNVVITEYLPAYDIGTPVAQIGNDPVRTTTRLHHIAAN